MVKKSGVLKPFEKRGEKNEGNEDTPPEKAKTGGKTPKAFGGKAAKPFGKKDKAK